MSEIKKVGDLFEIHFWGNTFFYIHLLREITKEDFEVITDKTNSIAFISEDCWDYGYNDYDKIYFAKYRIRLRLADEVCSLVKTTLPNSQLYESNQQIDFLHETFQRTITKKFKSNKKDPTKAAKEFFKKILAKDSEIILNSFYLNKIRQLTQNIQNINRVYEYELKTAVVKSQKFHNNYFDKHSPEIYSKLCEKMQALWELNKQIQEIEKELDSLTIPYKAGHIQKMKEVIDQQEFAPEIKELLKKELENKLTLSCYNEFPFNAECIIVNFPKTSKNNE